MNYEIAMAKMFKQKEREEIKFEVCIGTVIKAPPEIEISIWDGQVILLPHMLYMNDRLYDDYTRKFDIVGDITEITINTTSRNIEAGPGPHSHPHGIIKGIGKNTGKIKLEGVIKNTDTLTVGDYVKVVPTEKGQKWFIDSKYRKVKE